VERRGFERPRKRSLWMKERWFFCRLGLPQTGQRPDSKLVTLQQTQKRNRNRELVVFGGVAEVFGGGILLEGGVHF